MSSPSHLYNLFQMPNDRRMVNVDFLGNFLCSCKGISFNDCSQLVVVNFFFFFHLFLLVGGELLYNIVVVFVIH